MSRNVIRVLVVDDHALVRKGIRALLAEIADVEVVGEAGDGAEAIAQARALHPDVVLMDLVMPRLDGIEATRQLCAAGQGPAILVLTSFGGDDKVFPAIKAGALGYLLKDSDPAELLKAIRQVHRGEPSLAPGVARKVLLEMRDPGQRPPTSDPLTDREMEVLRLVATGLSNQEIAGRLVVTEATVRSHVSNVLAKLHLANRVQATLYALQEGLVSLDESWRNPEAPG
ncbi:MAG TPA: response regulator transcription factor [Anaerolineae bacterium]|nr:response regulator transcription factor [Anaerolineae bacterium]